MPHDSHTTHEPDRVGREGDEAAAGFGREDDLPRQPTLPMFGGFDRFDRTGERELAPATN